MNVLMALSCLAIYCLLMSGLHVAPKTVALRVITTVEHFLELVSTLLFCANARYFTDKQRPCGPKNSCKLAFCLQSSSIPIVILQINAYNTHAVLF